MLPLVETPTQKLEQYKGLVSEELLQEINELSRDLKGLKVFHVNSAPRGGGVAEILKSLVPLMRDIGLDARWYTIPGRNSFFEITKQIHNALQGKNYKFPFAARKRYLLHMARTAEQMRDMRPDIWVIHDPQPAGVIHYLPHYQPLICRIHIDLTSPNHDVWKFISGFLAMYDKVVLSSEDFIKEEIKDKAVIFQPAIDLLSPKNQALPLAQARDIIKSFGINPQKPLISQVSRFDPWKDPLGVIKAYQLAKKKIPDLQLVMAGIFLAKDDPEGERVYKKVEKKAQKDPDIFLFSEINRLGSLEVPVFVNAIQVASDVILQKSIREGFGLTAVEAMWKEKPVVGGNVGGLKLQIEDGQNGFLVSSPKETAQRILQLLGDKGLAERMGRAAKETVRERFSMPRLLRDYLKLFKG